MKLYNIDYVPGKEIEAIELVMGTMVMSKNLGRDITQGLKSIVGGELKQYTEMLAEARAHATDRMVAKAKYLDADAIVNVKYSSSSLMQGAAEIVAWGTAVKFKETKETD